MKGQKSKHKKEETVGLIYYAYKRETDGSLSGPVNKQYYARLGNTKAVCQHLPSLVNTLNRGTIVFIFFIGILKPNYNTL